MSDEEQIESEPMDSGAEPEVESGSDVQSSGDEGYSPQPEQAASVNYFDHFRNLPQFQGADDRAIAGALYQSMQRAESTQRALAEYQRLIPHAQTYAEHKPQFEQWLAQQRAAEQAARQPQQPEQKPLWNPPEVREAYKRFLVKDENGRDIIDPNAPPDAAHALYERQQYVADFAKNFLDNPEKTLQPFIERAVEQRASQIVDQKFDQISLKGYVANLEAENSDWLMDPRTKQPTEQGEAVARYIDTAQQYGITNPQAAWDYATAMTERDMMRQILAQQTQQAPTQYAPRPQQAQQPMQQAPRPAAAPARQQPTRDDFYRREAARNPSRSPAPEPGAAPTVSANRQGADLFAELMRRQADHDGLLLSSN